MRVKSKTPKPKPARKGELVRRARLAGLLLETLLSQDQSMLTADARRKIAAAAELIAAATRSLGRTGKAASPNIKRQRKAKRLSR